MVEGEGFEPSKAKPAELQSAPFDRSGIPPDVLCVLGPPDRRPTAPLSKFAHPFQLKQNGAPFS